MSRVGKVANRRAAFAEGLEFVPGPRGSGHHGRRDCGFTYIAVLIMLIALGLAAGTAGQVESQRQQAERETELLFRGLAYQRAIKSYYEAAPQNARVLPRELDDLLKDPRVQHRRHLRRLYPDPFAILGEKEGWRILRAEDGGILGIASRSAAMPLRQVNFPSGLEGLAGARTYADWQFVFTPSGAVSTPAARNR